MFKQLQTKFLALLAIMLMGGSYAWAETSTVNALKISNTSETWTGSAEETWAVAVSGGALGQNVTNGYAQVGTKASPSTSIKVSTSGITGTITSIAVDCASYNGLATVSATVGSSAFGEQGQSTPSWSSGGGEVTFSGNASGEIVITMTNGSGGRAMYIKSITVTYTAGNNPSISVNNKNIQVPADETDGTINVTYTNFSDVIADVAFYEEDGETTTSYDWITADINNDNNVEYFIEANTGEARTAYMKVYAHVGEANDVYSELITITQAAYVAPFVATTYNLASSITSGKHYIIASSNTEGAAQAMGTQKTNNRTGADVTVSNNTIQTTSDVAEFVICGPDAKGNYTIYDAAEGGYLYAASSSSNYLRTEETLDDNGRWSITFGDEGVANIVAKGSNTHNTMQYNSNNSLFSCYASASQGDVYLYEKADEATPKETVSITSAGLATFCSENALDFTGLTDTYAYIAQYNNDKVTYRKVTKVPARTGVLLRNPNGGDTSHEVPVLTGAADDVEGNKFIGTLTDIAALASVDGTNTNYILNNGDNGVGFYKANDKKVGAGKAYLQLPTEGAKTFIGFDEEGEATAISTIDNGQLTMDNVYNLQGQKVGSEYKGIVIVNGKKFINK